MAQPNPRQSQLQKALSRLAEVASITENNFSDGLYQFKRFLRLLYCVYPGLICQIVSLHQKICETIRDRDYDMYLWLDASDLCHYLTTVPYINDEPIAAFKEELDSRLEQDILYLKLKYEGLTFTYDDDGIPRDENNQIPPKHFAPQKDGIENAQFVGLKLLEVNRDEFETRNEVMNHAPPHDPLDALELGGPLSQFIFQRLIRTEVTEEVMISLRNSEPCIICYDGYKVDDVHIRIPVCRHEFHLGCIGEWLLKHDHKCSTCRLDLRRLYGLLEISINAAKLADAPDPYIFIVNHLRNLVLPVITHIKAQAILDSQGRPTIEVELFTNKGSYRASTPSANVFNSMTTNEAIAIINNELSEALKGMDPRRQFDIDDIIAESNPVLKANERLAVSVAVCRAGAAEKEVPLYEYISELCAINRALLPVPAITVITGGKVAGKLAFQEIMILPLDARTFQEALQIGVEIHNNLKVLVLEKYGATGCNLGDYGILSPSNSSIQQCLGLVVEAIDIAGYKGRVKIGLHVAATGVKYKMQFASSSNDDQDAIDIHELQSTYEKLCEEYPISSIWEPFHSTGIEANMKLATCLDNCQVVTTLGKDSLKSQQSGWPALRNANLLKVNQFQTVKEALGIVRKAKADNWEVVVSCSSPTTPDTFACDLAVGIGSCQIRAGTPCYGGSISIYNQLLQTEEELGHGAVYAGRIGRYPRSIRVIKQ